MTLRQFIGEKPKRGAFSRIAEHSGVAVTTVMRIYHGGNSTLDTHRRLQGAISARVKIFARPRSDAGKKRGSYRRIAKGSEQKCESPRDARRVPSDAGNGKFSKIKVVRTVK